MNSDIYSNIQCNSELFYKSFAEQKETTTTYLEQKEQSLFEKQGMLFPIVDLSNSHN